MVVGGTGAAGAGTPASAELRLARIELADPHLAALAAVVGKVKRTNRGGRLVEAPSDFRRQPRRRSCRNSRFGRRRAIALRARADQLAGTQHRVTTDASRTPRTISWQRWLDPIRCATHSLPDLLDRRQHRAAAPGHHPRWLRIRSLGSDRSGSAGGSRSGPGLAVRARAALGRRARGRRSGGVGAPWASLDDGRPDAREEGIPVARAGDVTHGGEVQVAPRDRETLALGEVEHAPARRGRRRVVDVP